MATTQSKGGVSTVGFVSDSEGMSEKSEEELEEDEEELDMAKGVKKDDCDFCHLVEIRAFITSYDSFVCLIYRRKQPQAIFPLLLH